MLANAQPQVIKRALLEVRIVEKLIQTLDRSGNQLLLLGLLMKILEWG